eukprot:scaffold47378_cov59-Phaeocystis_antarctica.AAC.5
MDKTHCSQQTEGADVEGMRWGCMGGARVQIRLAAPRHKHRRAGRIATAVANSHKPCSYVGSE